MKSPLMIVLDSIPAEIEQSIFLCIFLIEGNINIVLIEVIYLYMGHFMTCPGLQIW